MLTPSVLIGVPFARIAHIVKIEHGRNGIDAQSIDVVFAQPEEGAGDQEIAYLAAPIIKDIGAPLFMFTFTRISIFVQVGSIEVAQGMPVFREVCGNPVEDHADALLMHIVDEVLEILWRAETTGGSEVACGLIPPGAIEGKFCNGEQLDMRKTQIFHIVGEHMGQFAIGHKAVFFRCTFLMTLKDMPPRTEVYFIGRERRFEWLKLCSLLHPVRVLPGVLMDISDDTRSIGAQFVSKSIGIGLIDGIVIDIRIDGIFIDNANMQARHKTFPYSQIDMALLHGSGAAVPGVKVANNRYRACMGCPDSEIDAHDAIDRAYMSTELFINVILFTLTKQVEIEIAKDRGNSRLYIWIYSPARITARLLWNLWCCHTSVSFIKIVS